MSRPRTEYIQTQTLSAAQRPLAEPGMQAFILSEDAESGAQTTYTTVNPFWSRGRAGSYVASVELLVLSGDLTVGQHELSRGSYALLPPSWWHSDMSSRRGATFLMMTTGFPEFREHGQSGELEPATILNTSDMEWMPPPAFEGRAQSETTPDSFVKWLHVDPSTGAYSLLSMHGPRWCDRRIEAHEIWEELFMLEGDCLVGPTGALTAGSYIFRPEKIPHGPLASQTGVVWFGRGNSMIDFQYSTEPWADALVKEYLDPANSLHNSQELAPWGRW